MAKHKIKRQPPPKLQESVLYLDVVRYALYPLVFIILAYGLDRGMAVLLDHAFARTVVGQAEGAKLNQAVRSHADAYILGDSRAEHHNDPAVLSAATGLRFFNAGCEGRELMYLRLQADLIEMEQTPQLYLLDLSFHNFDARRSYRSDQQRYVAFPFVSRSAVAAEFFNGISTPDRYVRVLASSCRYRSAFWPIVRGLFGALPESPDGFNVTQGTLREGSSRHLVEGKIDFYALDQLLKFIQQSRQKQIQIVFCLGPSWRGDTEYELWEQERMYLLLLRQLAKLQHVPLIEATELYYPQFRSPHVFTDTDHLNAYGAHIYSQIVADHLRAILRINSIPALEASPYYPQIDPKDYIRN